MMNRIHAAVNYALKKRDAEAVRDRKRRERLAAAGREAKSARGTGRVPARLRGLEPTQEFTESPLGSMVMTDGRTVRANRATRRANGQRGGQA